MKKSRVFYVVIILGLLAILASVALAVPEMSTPESKNNGRGPFEDGSRKDVTSARYGSTPEEPNEWKLGLRTDKGGSIPVCQNKTQEWQNYDDPNTWTWPHGMTPFTLEFDKNSGEVVFVAGKDPSTQFVLDYTYEEYAGRGMNEMYIMAKQDDPNEHSSSIEDLEIDGTSLFNIAGLYKHTYATVTNIECRSFTLSGKMKLGWKHFPSPYDIEALFAFGEPCARVEPVITIDGVMSPGEWYGTHVAYVPSLNLDVYAYSNLNFLYLAYDFLDDTTDGRITDANDQLSVNIGLDSRTGAYRYRFGSYACDANNLDDPNHKIIDGYQCWWTEGDDSVIGDPVEGPGGAKLPVPIDLEYETRFDTGHRVSELAIPIPDLVDIANGWDLRGGDWLQIGGLIKDDENTEELYPDGLDLADGDTYEPVEIIWSLVIIGDLNSDWVVNIEDAAIMAENWLGSQCISTESCGKADIAPDPRDETVDFLDYAALTGNWFEYIDVESVPPEPNKMQWADPPTALDGVPVITMTAVTATDNEYDVEYYFRNLTDPLHFGSSWQESPVFTDAVLEPGTQYTYVVKARDRSPRKNETEFSDPASAVTAGGGSLVELGDSFFGIAAEDGYLGGNDQGAAYYYFWSFDEDALRLGNALGQMGYRTIVSFDVDLPPYCTITEAQLKLTYGKIVGQDPFSWGYEGGSNLCFIDIASPHFGNSEFAEFADFNGTPDAGGIARFVETPALEDQMASTLFASHGLSNINPNGKTQLRIYFQRLYKDNSYNYLGFYSGEAFGATYDKRPELALKYITRRPSVKIDSESTEDGRVWDEGTGIGDGFVSDDSSYIALRLGDWSDDTSYRSIVSFDTSVLPADANIVSAKLQLTRGGKNFTNDPFKWNEGNNTCFIDIVNPYFGTVVDMEDMDYHDTATVTQVATFPYSSDPGNEERMTSEEFTSAALNAIDKNGTTQLRVYFATPSNDDAGTDYIGFYPGECLYETKRPKLIIEYLIDL